MLEEEEDFLSRKQTCSRKKIFQPILIDLKGNKEGEEKRNK